MSEVRITIIECKGMDVDSEFGLVRTLSELLQRSGGAATAVTPATVVPLDTETVSQPATEPAPPARAPSVALRTAPTRTQEQIEDHIVDTLIANPDVSLERLGAWAYGDADKRRLQKITLTLKRLAKRGLVECLGPGRWRALSAEEREPVEGDEDGDEYESNGHSDDDEPEELDLG